MDETTRHEVVECVRQAQEYLRLPFRRPPSRVAGPRRVLTGLRRLVVKTHRLLTWRELTANEEFWAGRVQTALTALIAEGDVVVSDLPDPRDRRRVRKRERL